MKQRTDGGGRGIGERRELPPYITERADGGDLTEMKTFLVSFLTHSLAPPHCTNSRPVV